jgi:hypothetical protein
MTSLIRWTGAGATGVRRRSLRLLRPDEDLATSGSRGLLRAREQPDRTLRRGPRPTKESHMYIGGGVVALIIIILLLILIF